MIAINSFLHRELLSDLIKRWMYDQLQPTDADLVTRLVLFNHVFTHRYLDAFSSTLFGSLHERSPISRRANFKKDIKDTIVVHPPYVNTRIEKLILDFRKNPERYYRETPFQGMLYFTGTSHGDLYIGCNRIKRVRRLAEKSARRISDSIFDNIKKRVDAQTDDRARRLGIPRQKLFTRPKDMNEEFFKAEERFLEDLKSQRDIQLGNKLEINDVTGIKVILEDNHYADLLALLSRLDGCEILEEEHHAGDYNAINLIVKYTPEKKSILKRSLGRDTLEHMRNRGLEPDYANQEFQKFVKSGESFVLIEIIVSNYQEMLESEIGRCMHEDRIVRQRLQQEYRGHLAKNIEYLMAFLFNFAVSPQIELHDLPIKLWHRYLPDTFDEAIRSLFRIPRLRLTVE